jgi:hypothetical protein
MATPPEIETFVQAARDYVHRAVGLELDGSEASLAFVDHYISQNSNVKPQVVALVAPALGAYFGEVAIAKLGGAWLIEGDDPASWAIELESVALRFHPVGMAAAALLQRDVDGYDASFSTTLEWRGLLEEALAAVPPVDEGYFYSLTGRLETLEHAADILAALRQRAQPI